MKAKTIRVVLTNTAGISAFFHVTVQGADVKDGALVVPEGTFDDTPTRGAVLELEDTRHLSLTGGEWRRLEMQDCLSSFYRLVVLDLDVAKRVVQMMKAGTQIFRAIVTSDATESCTVFCSTDDQNDILDEARANGNFALNEGNARGEVYLGGGAEDIEEMDLSEYIDTLLADAVNADQTRREVEGQKLIRLVAGLQKREEWQADQPEGQPSINYDEDSAGTLQRLIDMARDLRL